MSRLIIRAQAHVISWRRKDLSICKLLVSGNACDRNANKVFFSFWDNVGGEVGDNIFMFRLCVV